MDCDNCGYSLRTQKSLRRGKSARPDECPECGAELDDQNDSQTRVAK